MSAGILCAGEGFKHSSMYVKEILEAGLKIAGEMSVYSNQSITVETL